jgi:hypothetical protein
MAKKDFLRGVIVASSIAGVVLSLVSTSRYGAGLSSDSTAYISAARSLLAGHGYVCHDGNLYTGWPPLFPTLLAGIGLVGIDPATGARFLNALAFGGIIFVSGVVFARSVKSKALMFVATSSVALSYPLLDISIMALTEAVFVLLIVLFVLWISVFLRDGRTLSLVIASILAGLCLLQRYTGVALIIAGVILIILSERHAHLARRLWHLACFLVISCTPTALWVVRNLLVTHMLSGHTRLHSVFSLRDNIVFAAGTATKWLVPESIPLSIRLTIIAGLLLLVTIVLLVSQRIQKGTDWDCSYVWSAGVVMLVYVPLLLYTHQVGVLNEPVNDRYLSPLAVLVLWVLFAGIDRIRIWLSHRLGAGAAIVVGLCALWLMYPLGRVREAVSLHLTQGAGGYAWKGWQTSLLIDWLREHPLSGTVRSNAPDALYALLGRSAAASPHRTWDMPQFREALSSGTGESLVWFSGLPQIYLYDLDELVSMLNIEEVAAFPDGGVYRLLPSANGVFADSRIFSTCMVNGVWNRSFTGDQSGSRGEITSWILRPDGTMDSTWKLSTGDGAAISWRGCGGYTRSGSDFEFQISNFEIKGTVNGDVATGTFRVKLTDPQWPAVISGSWRVDLAHPVYRLYSPQRGKHLYTMSKEEVVTLTNELLDRWAYEGVAFYAYPESQQPPDARPVYGLQSGSLGSRFFTMNEPERQGLLGNYGDAWSDAGVAFYAFSEGSHPYTSRPVYRFWSAALGDHLYTASEAERDKLINDYAYVWTYEGIAWYAIGGNSPQ